MTKPNILRRLIRDTSGVAAIEFAIVAVPLFLLLMGIMEFGLIYYTETAIESAMTQEARLATIASGSNKACNDALTQQILGELRTRLSALPNSASSNISAAVVTSPGTSPTTAPDVCLDDASTPYPTDCKRWQENNGIPGYQPPATVNCLGAAGDLVEIRVTYPWSIITPIMRPFFKDGLYIINSTIVLKNEPSLTP